jgi:hypothetical protein
MNAAPKAEQPFFIRKQYQFAAHIRDPQANPRPPDVEERRMAIYRELFYNNIEGFLADGFPVLRRISSDQHWHAMVRDFLAHHRSQTPLFPEFAQEFINYLAQERGNVAGDPPFLLELAHYEWVETVLLMSDADLNAAEVDPNGDMLAGIPQLSPLSWNLSYRFAVHRISETFQPNEPGAQATHLLAYRNRQDQVEFLEINAVTQRMLQLMQENPSWTGQAVILRIAEELSHPQPEVVMEAGRQVLNDLRSRHILIGTRV